MHCPLVDCELAVGAEEESLPRRMRRHMEAKKALRVWRAQPPCSQCKDTGTIYINCEKVVGSLGGRRAAWGHGKREGGLTLYNVYAALRALAGPKGRVGAAAA